MQQSVVKFYCFVVQTLLNMFRAPDDGHSNAQNMLSSVCMTKQ
jgi:hypothetical protein